MKGKYKAKKDNKSKSAHKNIIEQNRKNCEENRDFQQINREKMQTNIKRTR
jgi:hypothetical protein